MSPSQLHVAVPVALPRRDLRAEGFRLRAPAVEQHLHEARVEAVGKHVVEVCTNLSCALVGAQKVVEAFESELGCRAGETSADGKVTLRTVECLGGCGWATIVSVDHHYRTHVDAAGVPAIVEELRAGS